ncbi:MAG: diguanylate cyclase [Helicobacteraceae bacterium]|nr:diguanylate cyclase [Candidatus Sulfurimonas ponti]MBL6972788.1 diguanylate cyclase [Sulfurimonas sp.]
MQEVILNEKKYTIKNGHCSSIEKVLVIEDSSMLLESIKNSIHAELQMECDIASNEQEAMELLKRNSYDLVIADIYLPDSSGNFIGYLVRKKHRIIIITASDNEEKRTKIASLPIVDYLYKTDERTILNYLMNSIRRLQKNEKSTVMICDDSQLSRLQVRQLIVQQNLPYIEVKDGQEAYDYVIKDKLKINLLMTDVNMPKMDGVNLIRHIRHHHTNNELPVLAFSSAGKASMVAQLLKTGANDYISKPINNEEFLTRLNISLDQSRLHAENQQLIQNLKMMSETDFLTKLYNRSYFYRAIKLIQTQSKRHKQAYGVLMLDIDHFKIINDTHGHEAGDMALISLSKTLLETARESDIICRWGGEEFLILIPNTNADELSGFAQRIRTTIESSPIKHENSFNLTVSIGISISTDNNVDDVDNVIFNADNKLYKAKNSGRNCVVF